MSKRIVRTEKKCSKCGVVKPIDLFYVESRRPDGRMCHCSECHKVAQIPGQVRYKATDKYRAALRRRRLRNKFGLSVAEFDSLFEAQGFCCAICKSKKPHGRFARFHVDHDHRTDEVRGLLCNRCNIGLGMFLDDPKRLRMATQYIEKFKKSRVSERDSTHAPSRLLSGFTEGR